MKQFLHFLVVALFLTTVLAACNTESAPTLTDARRGVCQALDSLRGAVTTLNAIDPDTSVAQLKEMRENVGRLVEAARRANSVLQMQQITDMVEAFDTFSRTVDGLNPDQRVGDATAGLQASSARIISALDQAYQTAQCAQ
jgi:hypothetical protein